MHFLSKLLSIISGKYTKNTDDDYAAVQRNCIESHMSSEDIGKIMNVFRDISKYTEVQYNFYRNTDLENPLE